MYQRLGWLLCVCALLVFSQAHVAPFEAQASEVADTSSPSNTPVELPLQGNPVVNLSVPYVHQL